VPLKPKEFEDRCICGFLDFIDWMENKAPQMTTGKSNAAQTPLEQLDDILRKWITGRQMRYPQWIKDLMPLRDEVWELKTADLRIFGWIHKPRKFIAVLGGYADDYKARPELYDAARKMVIAARDELNLDPPKFATGTFDDLV
jgi:hypothetical protein